MNTISRNFKLFFGGCLFAVAMIAPAGTRAQQGNAEPVKHNEPRVRIDVKKEFDENGNVIRYDSTYSWSWTGVDTSGVSTSVFFKHGFEDDFSGFNVFSGFDNDFFPVPGDSLRMNFFGQQFNDNFMNMEKLMEEQVKMMEEMQLQFFGDPSSILPEEEEENNEPVKKKGISF